MCLKQAEHGWVHRYQSLRDFFVFRRFSTCFFKTKTLKCGEVRHRKVQYHQYGSPFQLPSVNAGEALPIGYEHCLSLAPPPSKCHSSLLCKAPPPMHQIGNSEYCPSITVHSWCPGHRSCTLFWSSWSERKGKNINHESWIMIQITITIRSLTCADGIIEVLHQWRLCRLCF